MKKFTYLFIANIFLFFASINIYSKPNKEDVNKLNNSILFDLFMNYELTLKSDLLSTIFDYSPTMNKNDKIKNIDMTIAFGKEYQYCTFSFNENGTVNLITTQVENMLYKYEFIYKKNKVTEIIIGGKPKIKISYDNNDRINKISREKSGYIFEYNFEYVENENKANIKLVVIDGNNKNPSIQKNYITWNSSFRIESLYFDAFVSKEIKYNDKGDLVSYLFSTSNKDNIPATWEYIAQDDKGNWTERKSEDTTCKRSIEYYQ